MELVTPNLNKVLIAGGLGNQLFQFACALSHFQGTEFELECFLHEANRDGAGIVEIEAYDLGKARIGSLSGNCTTKRETQILLQLSSSNSSMPKRILFKVVESLLSLRFRKKIKIISPTNETGFQELTKNGNFLVGYFHSYIWPSDPFVYKQLKELRLKVEDSAIDYYKKLAKSENPLVVHVRLGDYKQIESFGIPSQSYYEKSISSLWNSGKFKKIWIFTNEESEAVRYLPSWITEHARWIPEIGGSAAQTLEVMRLGYGYVIGNSTYSWWGAFLSYSDAPDVIAPSPWFKGMKSPNRLVPPHWSQMDAW